MAIKSLFPDEMLESNSNALTLESIASKFDYFFQQIHLLHLQTSSYPEHEALQIWDSIPGTKDEFMEKLMGYEGRRLKSYKLEPLSDYSLGMSQKVIRDLAVFAKQLENYGKQKGYPDIENLSQSLNGSANSILYLLTLS